MRTRQALAYIRKDNEYAHKLRANARQDELATVHLIEKLVLEEYHENEKLRQKIFITFDEQQAVEKALAEHSPIIRLTALRDCLRSLKGSPQLHEEWILKQIKIMEETNRAH